jgi:hypothetical protein
MRILDQFRRRSHRGVSCSLAKLTPQSTYRSLFSLFSSLASSGSHKLHKADSLYNYTAIPKRAHGFDAHDRRHGKCFWHMG